MRIVRTHSPVTILFSLPIDCLHSPSLPATFVRCLEAGAVSLPAAICTNCFVHYTMRLFAFLCIAAAHSYGTNTLFSLYINVDSILFSFSWFAASQSYGTCTLFSLGINIVSCHNVLYVAFLNILLLNFF